MNRKKNKYEEFVQRNVQERDELLKKLVSELEEIKKSENIVPPDDSRIKKKRSYSRRNIEKNAEPTIQTRSRSASLSSTRESTPVNSPKQMTIKFPFRKDDGDRRFRKIKVYEDEDEDFEDLDDIVKKRRTSGLRQSKRVIIPADDITDDDLDNVAVSSGGKVYDSVNGTTCHQCRQKTVDRKTECRSPKCVGIRGQFCGPCLKNRYGESAKEALLNPDWVCPPCRKICNCSFCRRKDGYVCTGIMIHEAKESGYQSVRHYLDSKMEKDE